MIMMVILMMIIMLLIMICGDVLNNSRFGYQIVSKPVHWCPVSGTNNNQTSDSEDRLDVMTRPQKEKTERL